MNRKRLRKQKGIAGALLLCAASLLFACDLGMGEERSQSAPDFARERATMVRVQIESRGVSDPRVLAAMRSVPRHRFVPERYRSKSYRDGPLPIGHNQTISQPYIVALMTELLGLQGDEKVLEIGTGSGYQAAVLTRVAGEVYSIEIVKPLCRRLTKLLPPGEYPDLHLRCGDGTHGWPEAAPFDAIMATAAPAKVPPALLEQLKVGGRLVVPVGDYRQELIVITRTPEGYERRSVIGVRFVPMTGDAQKDIDSSR